MRRTREFQDRFVDARRLHDAAVLGEIAEQDRKTAVLRIGVFKIANDAFLAVDIEFVESRGLAEGDLRRHAAGRGAIKLLHAEARVAAHVPARQRLAERAGADIADAGVDEARAIEFA